MAPRPTSHLRFLAGTLVCLGLSGFVTARAVYNSEEHKLIADRGAALVNQRSATFRAPTGFTNVTAQSVVDGYNHAKLLAVGFASNDTLGYSDQVKQVQDNSYYGQNFAQLAGNKVIRIPSTAQVATRVLNVTAWDGQGYVTFTFGELVALYGDYRRTVYCETGTCYLTNRDSPQYTHELSVRPAGVIRFEYGTDCYHITDCGWEPGPRRTASYLKDIGSGLWPPFGALGNQVSNTAGPEEELDAGWWGDEMMRIANVNDWHFSQAAVAWYIGAHRLALFYAKLARGDSRYWNHALHYEASALHSLTDLFAFGHVVNSRDRTSYAMMTVDALTGATPYMWMENVSAMGGGTRSPTGKIELVPVFPGIFDAPHNRNDFMASDRGTLALSNQSKNEHFIHDDYNRSGATVMNLKRQEFTIYGDFKLNQDPGPTQQIIAETVRASLQALFDGYESPKPFDEIAGVGSGYFDALLNIPVFVKTNPERNFTGEWTRWAVAVDEITGAGMVPDTTHCIMPFVDGLDAPPTQRSACTVPVGPAQADIVAQLLHTGNSLAKGDQLGLDATGNANGSYDVGDFLAWVRANHATPARVRP